MWLQYRASQSSTARPFSTNSAGLRWGAGGAPESGTRGREPAAGEGSVVAGGSGSVRLGLTPVDYAPARGVPQRPASRRLYACRRDRRSAGIRSRAGCGRRRPHSWSAAFPAANRFDQPLIRFTVRMMITVAAPPQRAMLRPPTTPVSPSPTAGDGVECPRASHAAGCKGHHQVGRGVLGVHRHRAVHDAGQDDQKPRHGDHSGREAFRNRKQQSHSNKNSVRHFILQSVCCVDTCRPFLPGRHAVPGEYHFRGLEVNPRRRTGPHGNESRAAAQAS